MTVEASVALMDLWAYPFLLACLLEHYRWKLSVFPSPPHYAVVSHQLYSHLSLDDPWDDISILRVGQFHSLQRSVLLSPPMLKYRLVRPADNLMASYCSHTTFPDKITTEVQYLHFRCWPQSHIRLSAEIKAETINIWLQFIWWKYTFFCFSIIEFFLSG